MLFPAVTMMLASILYPVSQPTPGELAQRVDALRNTGRVLYVAAHPDDENTQFLAWAASGEGYEAAYLSLTRGDGGQNLIGDEQSPLMGVIRTWELLRARATDGARQFISSARDFGYSKSAEEALEIWGAEETLGDVVRVVRTFRPHVIVTRFPEEGSTHGHHLASAQLAHQAFFAAADPAQYPEQLNTLDTWQATRVVHNVSTWRGEPDPADTVNWVELDVGAYQPLLGRSFGEVASESRGMHRSQGFGWWSSRGPKLDWFSPVAGVETRDDLFAGIDTTWNAYEGGSAVDANFAAAAAAFSLHDPALAIPYLAEALANLESVEDREVAETVSARVAELIVGCAGLVLDARVDSPFASIGAPIDVTWSALNRSESDIAVTDVRIGDQRVDGPGALAAHEPTEGVTTYQVPADAVPSAPYWLASPAIGGRYSTTDEALTGAPIAPPALIATFDISVDGATFQIQRPVRHIEREPTLGERARTLLFVPPVTVTPTANVRMLATDATSLDLEVQAYADLDGARLTLELPTGWTSEPAALTLDMAAGEHRTAHFSVSAPEGSAERATVRPIVDVAGTSWSWRGDVIDYPHLPPQLVLRPSLVDVQSLNLEPYAGVVGYVMGPGDLVAEGLQNVGIPVRQLTPAELTPANLAELDVLMIGIRAFNVHRTLADRFPDVLAWAEAGGTLITQYQTQSRVSPLETPVGAVALNISRNRVTDETAEVTVIDATHRAFTHPHVIGEADWANWVQERGLYFADTWDDAWTPLLSLHDDGEDAQLGSLLVHEYGEGVIVYTGISFFRQLPAGVPGAYRLLVNLLALGDDA